jgi:peroxiredoxin
VAMQLDNFIAVGQPAPDFSVPTLDGKTLKLSSLRGRYVLLDFWSTYCIHCIEEMPNLKATNDAFGKSGRLEIVSLSYDEKLQNAAAYVQAQHLPWQQCWVGDDAGQQAINAYSGNGYPQICLIGPDGIVLAKDLRGDKINSAIAAALAK